MIPLQRLDLFPDSTRIVQTPANQLTIGGCDLEELAGRYGTPLYLYDRATMDGAAGEYKKALAACYPGRTSISYASKAYLCTAIAQWAISQGLWVECTGGGEMAFALAAGVPREHILIHGVNTSPDDLKLAAAKAGAIVVDNLQELELLADLLRRQTSPFPQLWLRFRPGLAVDTHAYTQTGQHDSKFGMNESEIELAVPLGKSYGLTIDGLHFHQGSQFHDPAPIGFALEKTLDLMAKIGADETWTFSPGGGWGVSYHEDDLPNPSIETYVNYIAERLATGCRRRGLPLFRLHLEPGRSLVARAGVALYRVGAVKQTAGRNWVLLDGGLADNPRPALYGARYSALPVHDPLRPALYTSWLAGPYCESGDVLIKDLLMPEMEPGELVAIPVSGAYQLSMASNYNGARKPAVIWIDNGTTQLIQNRETFEDLVRRDIKL